jgi:hypothetical protein
MAHLDRLKQPLDDLRTLRPPQENVVNLGDGMRRAQRLYRKARWLAFKANLQSIFTGETNELIHLDSLLNQHKVEHWNYLGIREVPIDQIIGSEERSPEFDRYFNPRRGLNHSRWLDIATARFTKVTLPPIELIQLPLGYFAQSGHYRISVLRNLGEKLITAYVTYLNIRENVYP